MPQFCHLHNHTEFSLLDGAGKIDRLVEKAHACGMPAVGISDHGNLFGVPKFVLAARRLGLRPVIGSEFYLAGKPIHEKTKSNPTYHQILFACSEEGYRNLMRLSSIAWREGYYYKPRIDRQLLSQYAEGLIATTCCLASEINQLILEQRVEEAEQVFRWYLDRFGDNYYVEIQNHNLRDQQTCNAVLIDWARRYGVKLVATNDVHYIDRADADPHDLLLALQTDAKYTDRNRFRFEDDQKNLNPRFYFKTAEEMAALFPDHPEALETTIEIAEKCSYAPELAGELLLPVFRIPEGFADENDYLRHLTWEGARKKYPEITTELTERIERELAIIRQVGYAGYFLIVEEFTTEARRRGVFVGPGRGSAAGSVVAYCLGIIDIDPMRYQLLFERFLNPERVSPPDIDIDFDDEGREQVIDFVVERYGRESVAQIITYGTMGAKTAIRDVGRALDVPLTEVNRIAKFIPERPGITFDKALTPEDNPDHWQDLKNAFDSPDPKVQQMLTYARSLEGTARHTGIHASAIIIAPGKLADYVPLAVAKNKGSDKGEAIITQYDGPHAELAGLLKMDFLGLKTLTIIKTALRLIEQNYGSQPGIPQTPDDIRIEEPPPSDKPDEHIWHERHWKTYELYQNGETVATFQFESDGMRKYLRQLKPTNIEDLIAMNALYRPGPMDNIPSFIARKHGQEPIEYAHPLLEPILKNTYGIMVYQEQIMQCAQVLAGYSLGGADLLRRAMGKKKKEVMEKERSKFVEGCAREHGIPAEQAGQIFDTMEKFAAYGFNKSHSAAYSVLAFRTAYLKANFPAEYMAAVLSHNLDHIEKITLFMEECRRMGLAVLPPCVNESDYGFSVNKKRQIRFGLGAIKGLGESSARAIIEERAKGGPFKTLFDLTSRIDPRMITKKTLEALVYAGALDGLTDRTGKPVDRSRYLTSLPSDPDSTVLEQALRYGQRLHEERHSPQVSLFGETTGTTSIPEPEIPWCEPAPLIQRLNQEREVIGFFLSGHPLDAHRAAIDRFATCRLADLEQFRDCEIGIAGIVTAVQERTTRTGARFLLFTLEDFSGAVEIALFNDDYTKFAPAVAVDICLFIEARYEPNFRTPDQYEVRRLKAVRFLDTLIQERTKELVIQCRLDQLNMQLIDDINRLLLNHSGSCKVSFLIEDLQRQYVQKFRATSLQVAPQPELLAQLNDLNLSYVLR